MIRDVDAPTARAALLKKGFRSEPKRDHEMFFFILDGKKTNVWVKISRGSPSVFQGEIKRNAKSVGLRGDELYRILSCELGPQASAALCEAASIEPEDLGNHWGNVNWCNRGMSTTCQAQAMVHEFAHLCGWQDGDIGEGVPGESGQLPAGCTW